MKHFFSCVELSENILFFYGWNFSLYVSRLVKKKDVFMCWAKWKNIFFKCRTRWKHFFTGITFHFMWWGVKKVFFHVLSREKKNLMCRDEWEHFFHRWNISFHVLRSEKKNLFYVLSWVKTFLFTWLEKWSNFFTKEKIHNFHYVYQVSMKKYYFV